ncbi:MAG: hypothetical protein FJ096_07305 [Deltaproteobacteria bacterium]|nr:hypothetical protein [Deltaproteobacteria bacterium]
MPLPQCLRMASRVALLAGGLVVAPAACSTGAVPSGGEPCEPGTVGFCHPSPAVAGKGACRPGERQCVDGFWGECVGAVVPVSEDCDTDLDDDCDGLANEGCPCDPGTSRPCYTGGVASEGKGACTAGSSACVDAMWSDTCEGEVLPAATEACDGVDDDCDGSVDEGCACDAGETRACYPFPNATKDIGVCRAGAQACVGTTWGECVDAVGPAPELCNGADDDCNGAVDEKNPQGGGVCSSGDPAACGPGSLVCQAGKLVCVEGAPGGAEVCNGVDDDCNGAVDDGDVGAGDACETGQPGVCAAGTTACAEGELVCQPNAGGSAEVCNGVDDDCDGVPDDGNPGGGAACETLLLGSCKPGVVSCEAAQLACKAVVAPAPELCNGVDDDCDGAIDNGNPEGGGACDTGGVPPCNAGTKFCIGGMLSCEPTAAGFPEFCNGVDDNCDGAIDFDAIDCPGACFKGNCFGDIP